VFPLMKMIHDFERFVIEFPGVRHCDLVRLISFLLGCCVWGIGLRIEVPRAYVDAKTCDTNACEMVEMAGERLSIWQTFDL
jgi:hypothetical protein